MSVPRPGRARRLLVIARAHAALCGVAACGGTLASCSSTTPRADGLPQSELGAHHRKWSARAVSSYRYTVRRVCLCAPPVTRPAVVTVRDGAVREAVYADDGTPVAPEDVRFFATVDQLFRIVQDALDRGAEELAVTYDPVYGYPRTIRIDYRKAAVDDEQLYTASDLQPQP